jgi:ElaB/YqjD/DUF883 family membrane-anchored ribosome-binding protein
MGAKAKTAGDKLNEALKKADDAVKELKTMGESAKVALSEDYSSLKEAIVETNVAKKIVEAKDKIVSATGAGVEKVKESAAVVDENVRSNPYHYIGGALVVGFLLGLLIGRKN